MTARIHPTAVVDPKAHLGEDVEIGPYAIIGPEVAIGARCKIWHHATLWGWTTLGEDNEIFPYASIGMKTQDMKFRGGRPGTRIGSRNTFREYVSINAATNDGELTELGDDNLLLAYCHVGHACKIGNRLIASNGVAFAGHVIVEDSVGIGGGGTAIHQFCHLGRHCFIGGCSKVEQDVPPFMLADGNPAKVRMFNKVGLERGGFDASRMSVVKALFKAFYRSGLNRHQAIEAIESGDWKDHPDAQAYLAFVRATERGITGGSK